MKKSLNFLLLSALLTTCGSKQAFTDHSFEIGRSMGIVDNTDIDEASGIAASISNPGMLWTHNDSGDKPRLFLIDSTAHWQNTFVLTGAENRDWEDIAVGPGPSGMQYVYIADIGDNQGKHPVKTIYRFVEPKTDTLKTVTISSFDIIRFQLSDGPKDTETLLLDPVTKDLYVVTKREPEEVGVYRLPFPQSTNDTLTAKWVTNIPYPGIVGGDISPDGSELILKTYVNVFYWKRHKDERIEDALKRPALSLPYATEPQGEAIAFDRENKGYYTLSEAAKKKRPHLMFYRRK